jgi:hypothetical protein
MTPFNVRTHEDRFDLEAHVRPIGRDLLVAIWGGDKPHIGAVGMAQPRPSLRDPERTSATASVFCLLGHKEDELVKAAAETLAAALNTNVVVTAGIHWDHLAPDDIGRVIHNTGILLDMILEEMAARSPQE